MFVGRRDQQGSLEMEPTDLGSNRSARLPGGRMSLDVGE
jgi:hypothetical protein